MDTFTAADLRRVAQVAGQLSRPLDFPDAGGWRSAVNRSIRRMVGADSAGFVLPVPGAAPVYSDEHPREVINRFLETPIPLRKDGRTVFEKILTESPVALLEDSYSGDPSSYLKSAYYNEYAGANGAHDSFVALAPLPELAPEALGGIMLWHERPDGRVFGRREKALLEAVYPALVAGMQAEVRWGRYRLGILDMLDDLGEAALVIDDHGIVAHETRTLAHLLAGDAEGDELRARMRRCAVGRPTSSNADHPLAPRHHAGTATAMTGEASYRITTTLLSGPGGGSRSFTIVSIRRTSLRLKSEAELQQEYGITRAERRVAAQLLSGRSAREIADAMCLSPHTVRRHTERLLEKTASPSKAALPVKLLE